MDLGLGIVARFGLGGRDVADGFQKPSVVEPVDPLQGGELHGLEGPPRAATVDDLSLEQADHRLGEGIVVAVTDAADVELNARLRHTLLINNDDVLRSPVRVADQPGAREGPALMKGLLQGIEHEVRPRRARDAPAHDPTGIRVDDEGDVDEA